MKQCISKSESLSPGVPVDLMALDDTFDSGPSQSTPAKSVGRRLSHPFKSTLARGGWKAHQDALGLTSLRWAGSQSSM